MRILNISLIFLSLSLASCGAQYHINKADKHKAKAIEKGAVIDRNIDTVNTSTIQSDTISINDTVFITNTEVINEIITVRDGVNYVTRADKRRIFKLERLNKKQAYKINKQQKKLDHKSEVLGFRLERARLRNTKKKLWSIKNIVTIALVLITIYLWIRQKKHTDG